MVVDDFFAAYGAEQSVIYTANAGEFVIETQGALIIHIFFHGRGQRPCLRRHLHHKSVSSANLLFATDLADYDEFIVALSTNWKPVFKNTFKTSINTEIARITLHEKL